MTIAMLALSQNKRQHIPGKAKENWLYYRLCFQAVEKLFYMMITGVAHVGSVRYLVSNQSLQINKENSELYSAVEGSYWSQ